MSRPIAMRVLIVRLGALGDVVHTIPVAAALGRRFPDAAVDWAIDERFAALLELVPGLDRRVVLRTRGPTLAAWRDYRDGRGDNSFFVWQWITLGLMKMTRAPQEACAR